MKKTDLQLEVGISAGTLAKLGRNETVSMDILMRICTALSLLWSSIFVTVQPTFLRMTSSFIRSSIIII